MATRIKLILGPEEQMALFFDFLPRVVSDSDGDFAGYVRDKDGEAKDDDEAEDGRCRTAITIPLQVNKKSTAQYYSKY